MQFDFKLKVFMQLNLFIGEFNLQMQSNSNWLIIS